MLVSASKVCFVLVSAPRDDVWNPMAATNPEHPDFLTIEEAARVLRIGRTAAYELARTWRATSGKQGLPVVAFGRLLRVPRAALEELCGGPITMPRAGTSGPIFVSVPEPVVPSPVVAHVERTRPSALRHRRTRNASPDQTSLPFD